MTTVVLPASGFQNRGPIYAMFCLVSGIGGIVLAASGHASALDRDVMVLGAWLGGPIVGALLLDHDGRSRLGMVLATSGVFPAVVLIAGIVETGGIPEISRLTASPWITWVPIVCLAIAVLIAFPTRESEASGIRFGIVTGPAVWAATALAAPAMLFSPEQNSTAGHPVVWVAAGIIGWASAVTLTGRVRVAQSADTGEAPRQRFLILLALAAVALVGVAGKVGGGSGLGDLRVLPQVALILGVSALALRDSKPEVGYALGRLTLLGGTTTVLVLTYQLSLEGLSWTALPSQASVAAAATALMGVALIPLFGTARDQLAVALYGEGHRSDLVFAMLSKSLGTASEAEEVLRMACDVVANAVRSPSVTVAVDSHAVDLAPGSITVPLPVGGESVGMLVVAPRRAGEQFTRREVELIEPLAAVLAQVARATRLSEALDSARRDAIDQRLDERRRVRRDLHDRLGPLLAGLGLKLNTLDQEQSKLHEVAEDLKRTVRAARLEVRRLVDGLEPEQLSEASLGASLAELVEGWASSTIPIGLTFQAEIAADLPRLSDTVRVAVYRVAGEAITNVVRHSGAKTCKVSLGVTEAGELVLEVADDGTGLVSESNGFGLRSMRERAATVGGALEVDSPTSSGTCVRLTVGLEP